MSIVSSVSLALSAMAVGISLAVAFRRPPTIHININQEEEWDAEEEDDLPMDDSIGETPPLLTKDQWGSLFKWDDEFGA